MEVSGKNLRLVLGVKLKQLRQKQGYSLKELSQKSQISLSYLSEIEKGKKYPTPEKALQLARALNVSFDDLVTLKMGEELDPLTAILESPFLKEFPFQLYGLHPRDIVGLVKESPRKAGALLRTLLDIGQTYDMRVEQFLFAALRSYQKMHQNYFDDLEEAAEKFRQAHGWPETPPSLEILRETLIKEYGYDLDEAALKKYPELQGFRSVFVSGATPKLLLNENLLPAQKAFILSRELGYCHLKLVARALTSSWLKVESFEQVLNNFQASYFAGALLLHRDLLQRDLQAFFQKPKWDGEAFLQLMARYQATPEMFLYRLSQLLPKLFGLKELFYLRFYHEAGSEAFHLNKELNMSRMLVPHGVGLHEHYCRRWLSIRILQELAEEKRRSAAHAPLIGAQRSHFITDDVEYFIISLARPLVLHEGTNASMTLGLLINEDFKKTVHFGEDPALPRFEVNETCERCGLAAEVCKERAAAPLMHQRERTQSLREAALQQLMRDLHG
ncbi:helix-turn-helix domain-containing protein [candidate division KSB1 bacterium]|nr:helix-turn-helix domain-containing protein [candidate division KSB1 bacterium]